MRDIADYEINYKEEPCEAFQVKYRRKSVLELMNKNVHQNVLEIGCGMEPLFVYSNDYQNWVLVEPGDFFIANARAQSAGKNVIFIQGFLEDKIDEIEKSNFEFDYIILSSLLHEVENPDSLLEGICTLCNAKTIVHINVPNALSIHRLLAKEMGLIRDEHELSDLQIKMQRNRVFDLEMLINYVECRGFEVVESGSYFPKFLAAGQMEAAMNAGIIDDTIFAGLSNLSKYLPQYGSEIFVQAKRHYPDVAL